MAENENGPRENNSILLDVRNITFKKKYLFLITFLSAVTTWYDWSKRRRNRNGSKSSLWQHGKEEMIKVRFLSINAFHVLPLQRRVTTRRYKYFYNPIESTPFSLGLAIPEGYGMYEVLGEQEIKHSHINGNNFKLC